MTLNQVIQRLQNLSLSHKQIRSFYYGDVVNFLANGDKVYPAVCASILPGNISKENRATTYNFRLYLCDLVNVSENSKSNELEVHSDMTSVSEDILALMNYPGYLSGDADGNIWDVSQTVNTNYATEDLEDMVGAVFFDVAISTRYDSNRCATPSNDIVFNNPNNDDMTISASLFLRAATIVYGDFAIDLVTVNNPLIQTIKSMDVRGIGAMIPDVDYTTLPGGGFTILYPGFQAQSDTAISILYTEV